MNLDKKITIVVGDNRVGKTYWIKKGMEIQKKINPTYNAVFIENPETKIYPSEIIKQLDFILQQHKDSNIIIETLSTIIVNHLRYLVFKEKINPNDLLINYWDDNEKRYDHILINSRGKFTYESGEIIKFPKGFFDVGLDELLEMM